MSYSFTENFERHDDNSQSYFLSAEKTHCYRQPDGKVTERGYVIERLGCKQLFHMPELTSFSLSASVSFSEPANRAWMQTAQWNFAFGYQPETREGSCIHFLYRLNDRSVKISLSEINRIAAAETASVVHEDVALEPEKEYSLCFTIANGEIKGRFDTIEFAFPIPLRKGIAAIENVSKAAPSYYRSIRIDTEETPACKELFSARKYVMPPYDGGEKPLCMELSAKQYENGICNLVYSVTGGAYDKEPPSFSVDNWAHEFDLFENPYFGFVDAKKQLHKWYIRNGKLVFAAQNCIGGKAIEIVMKGGKMPFSGSINTPFCPDGCLFFFGYDYHRFFGGELFGNGSDFLFDPAGNCLYYGRPLANDFLCEVSSPKDKKIVSLIPKDSVNYEDAVLHAQRNHFFLSDEAPRFSVLLHTKRKPEFLTCHATLTDAFLEPIKAVEAISCQAVEHPLRQLGFSTFLYEFELPPMEQGVYHLELSLRHGEEICLSHRSAFEVLDEAKKESPQESSGLPFLYVRDGGPIDTEYTYPDPWSIPGDSNIDHYFECAHYLPHIAEKRNVWELLKLYHRSSFIWMTKRTVGPKPVAAFPNCLRYADYINYPFPAVDQSRHYYRCDIWTPEIYDSPVILAFLKEYLTPYPDVSEKIFGDGHKFGKEDMHLLDGKLFDGWVDFLNKKTEPLFTEQWNEVKKQNPNAKRSSYGPYPIYGTLLSGGYNAKWYGLDPKHLSRLFDGFLQFEDYPFACDYPTHRSAWGYMTVKLLCPTVRLSPELYDSFDPICPDGFVGYAIPPLGENECAIYQTATQIYEYVFNAPIYRNGSFSYPKDRTFMINELCNREAKKRLEELLRAWGTYRHNLPAKPVKSIAYLADFDAADDRREYDAEYNALSNIGVVGECYLHGLAAESGLPLGFVTDFEGILDLPETQVDLLVLPSLAKATAEQLAKIRDLHKKGVSLFATSSVSGLEDLFGVLPCGKTERVARISDGTDTETVFPYDCEFRYAPNGAESVLSTAGGTPVLMRYQNTAILNTSVNQLGVDSFKVLPFVGRGNVSELLRAHCCDLLRSLSKPVVTASPMCGVNLFRNERGELDLLLVDYSDRFCPNETVTVTCAELPVRNVTCLGQKAPHVQMGKQNGLVKEFTVSIHPKEALLFRLSEN